MSDEFRTKLRALRPVGPRNPQSAARVRVKETFEDIAEAKKRDVTWQAIAALMNESGIRATDGTPLTAAIVSAAFSAEKAARGGRKQRKTNGKSTAAPAGQTRLNALQPAPSLQPASSTTDEDQLAEVRREMNLRSGRKV